MNKAFSIKSTEKYSLVRLQNLFVKLAIIWSGSTQINFEIVFNSKYVPTSLFYEALHSDQKLYVTKISN